MTNKLNKRENYSTLVIIAQTILLALGIEKTIILNLMNYLSKNLIMTFAIT